MNIIFNDTDTGSLCYYNTINSKGEFTGKSFRAAGNCYGFPPHDSIKLLFYYDDVAVSEDEFNTWLSFCSSCGFKTRGYAIENLNTMFGYHDIIGKYYTVILDKDDYATALHLFAAMTVIRMISYRADDGRFVEDSQQIIKNICELLTKNSGDNPLSILLKAHAQCTDSGHFLISRHAGKVSDISSDELFSLFKQSKSKSLNIFFSSINPKPF